MQLNKARGAKAECHTDRIGIAYMLQGEPNTNNTDPFDTEQSPGEVWVQEGAHLMGVLPDAKLLEGISEDPHNGGPYVMWKGTPYAHIMLPVATHVQKKKESPVGGRLTRRASRQAKPEI